MRGLPRNSPLPENMEADARLRLERLVGELTKLQADARHAKMVLPLPGCSGGERGAGAPAGGARLA
jgi:hypothetical protein